MSSLIVETCEIVKIDNHPGADRLEIATVKDWQCVIQKGVYKVGQIVLYIPIDSILPEKLEADIFGIDSKVKLSGHRVRTIKLRGAISQGLIVPLKVVGLSELLPKGINVAEKLGITKYEPPENTSLNTQPQRAGKKQLNPFFKKYTDIENIKNYNNVFGPKDKVIITEKIHGSNYRVGKLPFYPTTIWQKIKKFLHLTPEYKFVYGSHNVQISEKLLYKGYYDKNIYAEQVFKYGLEKKIPKDYVVYGEIYGTAIQKDYSYGLNDERRLVVFDVMWKGQYMDYDSAKTFATNLGLDFVPLLYRGEFKNANVEELFKGPSKLSKTQLVKEGCVIRSEKEEMCHMGRKVLKAINPEYLLKDNTDFH